VRLIEYIAKKDGGLTLSSLSMKYPDFLRRERYSRRRSSPREDAGCVMHRTLWGIAGGGKGVRPPRQGNVYEWSIAPPVNKELSDTLMHLSGYIFRAAIDAGLRRK
jgi:hypothetical protein